MIDCIEEKGNCQVMFFDEGRFGLRSTTMRIWSERDKPLTILVQQGFKNFYGYTAVSPYEGSNFSLLLSGVDTEYMTVCLEKLSEEFKDNQIILIMDQAGWHKSKDLKVP